MVNKKIALQAIGEQNSTFLCSKSILGKCEEFVKCSPNIVFLFLEKISYIGAYKTTASAVVS
jgi:hypothetical protein